MADQHVATPADPNTEKSEMRIMWIASAVTVLVILGAMGINMLMHHDTNAATPETTQSPPK
jgi:flagellar basal body-associated protein FliL